MWVPIDSAPLAGVVQSVQYSRHMAAATSRKPRKTAAASDASTVPLPAFVYRGYQSEAREAFRAGKRRQFLAWHRRAGKDAYAMQLASEEMQTRTGNYWHLFPLHAHARRALWEGIDPATGLRYIDRYFPIEHREHINNTEMFIRMKADSPYHGSAWQLLGSDYFNRLVGAGTIGITVSEWALCDPRFYEYVRPIIRENKGWIVFITTFRGRNHAYQMFKQLEGNAEWFTSLRTIRDTCRADGTPVISEADVAKDRAEGMTEARIQEEYYCNPAAALPGTLYGTSVTALTDEGRRSVFAYDARYPVQAAWSLEYAPVNISAAFFQPIGNEVRAVGCRSWMFATLPECVAAARATLPWKTPAQNIVPPDDDGVYSALLSDLGLYCDTAPALAGSKVALVTQAFISRLHIDNVPRPFERVTALNNDLLIDSLNGYRLKESADSEEFTLNRFVSFEQYLARAVEHYASWEARQAHTRSRPRNYATLDRVVI